MDMTNRIIEGPGAVARPKVFRMPGLFVFILLCLSITFCPMHAFGAKGNILIEKNIFIPPSERSQVDDQKGGASKDQFLDHYLLYGIISSGDYGVALLKINPKKRREVPKEMQDKKLIRLRPGESIEGYRLKSLSGTAAIFEKRGKIIRMDVFDLAKKPERNTRISVARATPQHVPSPSMPSVPPLPSSLSLKSEKAYQAHVEKSKTIQAKKKDKSRGRHSSSIGPSPVRNAHTNQRSNTPPASSRPNPESNPFIRAIQRAKGRQQPASGVNPFIQMMHQGH